ncbi:MAG: deaminase [Streptococcaceae bacterium]|jgi:deoxycytidylate deaminase|nr:deaminase [Streptococcaceae bacterium]MCH4176253.1 deaminase [Streptococcaceae bacterium]
MGTDLFIGLVYTMGTNKDIVKDKIISLLEKDYGYEVIHVKYSDFIEKISFDQKIKDKNLRQFYLENILNKNNSTNTDDFSNFEKINFYMNLGNVLREKISASYCSMKAINYINEKRLEDKKYAFILDSFKHPEEIKAISNLYRDAFYIFSVYSSEEDAITFLNIKKDMSEEEAQKLINRDKGKGENPSFGQQMKEAFQLGDFFIDNDEADHAYAEIERIIDLMHGHPYHTPTKEEYLMFNAYIAGSKSADLSRQVGALIGNNDGDVLATGANDCVKADGGQYWTHYNKKNKVYDDNFDGRDYKLGIDSNKSEINKIKEEISRLFFSKIKNINIEISDKEISRISKEFTKDMKNTQLNNLTEYGRVVHAEMNALLACSRNGISVKGNILYCTTFPCHNCAKHIVGSGIKKVIYIEPYPKSKTLEFYKDSITKDEGKLDEHKVLFTQFMGIGPNKYLELFSMNYKGDKKIRKNKKTGEIIKFKRSEAKLRNNMSRLIYIEQEDYLIKFVYPEETKKVNSIDFLNLIEEDKFK